MKLRHTNQIELSYASACTCEAWNHAYVHPEGHMTVVHSESCDLFWE